MTVEDEIRSYSAEIEELRLKVGIPSLRAYVQPGDGGRFEPLFVVDLDVSQMAGYADRYFDMMFGLQRIFARPVDMWESHMFEAADSGMFEASSNGVKLNQVHLELKNAA